MSSRRSLYVTDGVYVRRITADDRLSNSAAETVEVRFFDVLKLPEMPENEKRTVEKYLEWKQTGKFQFC